MNEATRTHAQPTRKPSARPAVDVVRRSPGTFGAHAGISPGASDHAAAAGAAVLAPARSSPHAHGAIDFSRIQPDHSMGREGAGSSTLSRSSGRKKVCASGDSIESAHPSAPTVRAISGSGSGTVTTSYTPEPSDKSTKIVFIQVMQESLDGVPTMPSVIAPAFAYQDADTTSDFYHVDYVSGEKDPYYNGDDAGDFGTQGNAITKVAASTTDTPHYNDASFPPGKSKLLWDFRTAAFSADGADAGSYYGYSDWSYVKDKGIAGKTTTKGTGTGGPGSKFESAVKLWNGNHGFKMPGGGGHAVLGGVLGGLAGAGIGAGIGFAAGGALGAAVGALVGLGVGAAAGALAGRKESVPANAGRAK